MLRSVFFCISTLMIFFLGGCQSPQKEVQKLSEPLVINVLDKELYDDCHIAGSIHVPFNQVEQYVRDYASEGHEIVLYCSNYACSTSHYVAQNLCKAGFTNVKVYEGGMAEWWQYGFPIEGPAVKPYLSKIVVRPESDGQQENCVQVISIQDLAAKLHFRIAPQDEYKAA